MNVGVISSHPPPPTGIATYTQNLFSNFLECGARVTVLSNTCDPAPDDPRSVYAWNSRNPSYPFQLFRAALTGEYDLLHLQHEYWLYGRGLRSLAFLLLLLLLRLSRRPLVVTMHCIVPFHRLNRSFFAAHRLGRAFTWLKRIYFFVYTKTIDLLASKVIVHSDISKNTLLQDYGFEAGNVMVIPHGTSQIRTGSDHEKDVANSPSDGRSVLLIFGQIRRGKGIEDAIRLLPRVLPDFPDLLLVVAGLHDLELSPESTGYLESLQEKAAEAGVANHVSFVVNLSDREADKMLKNAKIVLLPYVEDELIAASGPALLALAYGKPIVGTRLLRFSGYLEDGRNAILVPPSNPSKMAKAVRSILRNPALGKRLSRSAQENADGLNWQRIREQTMTLYQKLTGT